MRETLRVLGWPFYNEEERRLRAAWRLLAHVAVLVVLWAGPQYAIGRVRAATEDHREAFFSTGGVFMVSTLAVMLSVWLCARFLDHRALDGVGLRPDRRWAGDLVFGIVLGGVLMCGIGGVEHLAGLATYGDPPELPGDVPGWAYAPMTAFIFVAVGVTEELVFRGYHLTNLAEGFTHRRIAPWAATLLAVGLSSVGFGLAHVGNPSASAISTGNIVAAGCMLALGYVLTGNLAIPIGLHIGWNFFQNLLDMPVSGQAQFTFVSPVHREVVGAPWLTGGDFGPEAGFIGFCAMALAGLAIAGWVRVRHGPLRVHPSFGVPPASVTARV